MSYLIGEDIKDYNYEEFLLKQSHLGDFVAIRLTNEINRNPFNKMYIIEALNSQRIKDKFSKESIDKMIFVINNVKLKSTLNYMTGKKRTVLNSNSKKEVLNKVNNKDITGSKEQDPNLSKIQEPPISIKNDVNPNDPRKQGAEFYDQSLKGSNINDFSKAKPQGGAERKKIRRKRDPRTKMGTDIVLKGESKTQVPNDKMMNLEKMQENIINQPLIFIGAGILLYLLLKK